jgi:hypothetical protein
MRRAVRCCVRVFGRLVAAGGRLASGRHTTASWLAGLAAGVLALSLAAGSSRAASAPAGPGGSKAVEVEREEGEPPGEQEAAPTEAERQQPNQPVTVLHEVPSLRTETSDTYLLSDGAYSQRIQNHPVNFRAADGSWQPIEDQLVQQPDGSWQPQSSPTPVSLPPSLGSGPVSIGSGDSKLSFQLEGARTEEGAPAGPSRVYREALPDTAVTYALTPQVLRETLTLSSTSAPTVFRYKLSLARGLHASQQQDGSVLIQNTAGAVVYTLTPPNASDSSADRPFPTRGAVRYELSPDGSTLSLIIDKNWLDEPHRVFPVTIDPEAWIKTTSDCSIISAGFANNNYCGTWLYVGPDYPTASEGIARSLLYFDTSCVPRGSVITQSSLHLFFSWYTGSSPINIEAHALTQSFTSGATWNKYDGTNAWGTPGGDFKKAVAGERVVNHSEEGKELQIGFTPQVEQWVRNPSSNHGILLKAENETVAGYDSFAQSGNSKYEPEPTLEVVYEPRLGIPPMGQVYQQSLALGATMSVNVANGNLYLDSPDVNYATEGYDTELGRTYNSQDDLLEGASLGNWRLTKGDDTKLYGNEWDGAVDFYGPDGSDTRFDRAPWADNHPVSGDKAFTGEAGFNEGLLQHESGARTLTFPTGVEWKTDTKLWSIPTEIIDPGGEGNTISLSYASERLSELKDTHGHTLKLTREAESHRVTKINSGTETWTYAYKEGRLITVTNPANETAKYTYYTTGYGTGLLESISDPNGTWVISYDECKRVSSIRKLVNGTIKKAGSEDEITTFSYETEQTTVTQPTGAKPVYYYDEFGNALEELATQEAAVEFYAAFQGIEAEAARKAVDLQDHAAILDSELSQQLGEGYAGEWFNPATGKVNLAITSEGYERTAETDLDNLGLSESAEIVPASNSLGSLSSETDTLEAKLAELAEKGLVRLGIRNSSDAVLIEEASSISPSQEATVASAVASAKTPVVVDKTTVASLATKRAAAECSQANCSPPLRGGVEIETRFGKLGEHKFVSCTAGFVAQSDYGPNHYVITAGHCIHSGEGKPEGGVGGKWKTNSTEFGEALAWVEGHEHHVGGTVTDHGDEGLIYVKTGSEFGKSFQPWVIVYGNSAFFTTRNERYVIRGTHYNPGQNAPEQFVVCMGGAPGTGTESYEYSESETLTVQQAERCGVTEGFRNIEGGVEHVEKFEQCDSANPEGLGHGASGAPVYKNGLAFGVYSSFGGARKCEGFYEGINTIEGVFHVHVLRAG